MKACDDAWARLSTCVRVALHFSTDLPHLGPNSMSNILLIKWRRVWLQPALKADHCRHQLHGYTQCTSFTLPCWHVGFPMKVSSPSLHSSWNAKPWQSFCASQLRKTTNSKHKCRLTVKHRTHCSGCIANSVPPLILITYVPPLTFITCPPL